VHPTSVEEAQDDVITPLRELAKNPRVVAIGEAGSITIVYRARK
jgi:Tat protein secretion system quality control protein TatD with DNase activity